MIQQQDFCLGIRKPKSQICMLSSWFWQECQTTWNLGSLASFLIEGNSICYTYLVRFHKDKMRCYLGKCLANLSDVQIQRLHYYIFDYVGLFFKNAHVVFLLNWETFAWFFLFLASFGPWDLWAQFSKRKLSQAAALEQLSSCWKLGTKEMTYFSKVSFPVII
jgi:hypothetical protein